MNALPVHVLDDDEAVLASLGKLLGIAGYPTVLYHSPAELLAASGTLEEGCLLLDVLMPGMSGLALLEELRRRRVDLPAIVITGQPHAETALAAARLGATGFLEKPFREEQLLSAVKAVSRIALAPSHADAARQHVIDEAAARVAVLSKRERQVLAGLTRGDAHKVIAYNLGISVRTVEVHSARMLRRLGVPNLAQAIGLAAIAELHEGSARPS